MRLYSSPSFPPVYTYEIVNTYPHDPQAFTQGLLYDNGTLYESTGLNGASSLRQVELNTGRVIRRHDVPAQYFAEGLALWQGRLIQLTWRDHVAFVYDKQTFKPVRQFRYDTEGWGLTHDGRHLILSDGTATLRFLNPETFKTTRKITVTDNGSPIDQLNELEYVKGEILANIWQTRRIARISPKTGKVNGWIDLSGILDPAAFSTPVDVLNGIAYDAKTDRLFVTGKLWPRLYEIRLKRIPQNH